MPPFHSWSQRLYPNPNSRFQRTIKTCCLRALLVAFSRPFWTLGRYISHIYTCSYIWHSLCNAIEIEWRERATRPGQPGKHYYAWRGPESKSESEPESASPSEWESEPESEWDWECECECEFRLGIGQQAGECFVSVSGLSASRSLDWQIDKNKSAGGGWVGFTGGLDAAPLSKHFHALRRQIKKSWLKVCARGAEMPWDGWASLWQQIVDYAFSRFPNKARL